MANVTKVLAWADELCVQALTEARGGNASMLNRLGTNSAMKLYFDNVHGLHSVARDAFPHYYAPQFKEITRLFEQYQHDEQQQESIAKIDTLEAKIGKLEEMLTAFIESQQAPAPEAEKPAKSAKGKKAEVVEETPESEDDGESES